MGRLGALACGFAPTDAYAPTDGMDEAPPDRMRLAHSTRQGSPWKQRRGRSACPSRPVAPCSSLLTAALCPPSLGFSALVFALAFAASPFFPRSLFSLSRSLLSFSLPLFHRPFSRSPVSRFSLRLSPSFPLCLSLPHMYTCGPAQGHAEKGEAPRSQLVRPEPYVSVTKLLHLVNSDAFRTFKGSSFFALSLSRSFCRPLALSLSRARARARALSLALALALSLCLSLARARSLSRPLPLSVRGMVGVGA